MCKIYWRSGSRFSRSYIQSLVYCAKLTAKFQISRILTLLDCRPCCSFHESNAAKMALIPYTTGIRGKAVLKVGKAGVLLLSQTPYTDPSFSDLVYSSRVS